MAPYHSRVSLGRTVFYTLTADDAEAALTKRHCRYSHDGTPLYIGSAIRADDELSAVVSFVHSGVGAHVNLRVNLDGDDTLWVQDIPPAPIVGDSSQKAVAGHWRWPPFVPGHG